MFYVICQGRVSCQHFQDHQDVDYPRAPRAPSVFQTLSETDDPRTRGCSQIKMLGKCSFVVPTRASALSLFFLLGLGPPPDMSGGEGKTGARLSALARVGTSSLASSFI